VPADCPCFGTCPSWLQIHQNQDPSKAWSISEAHYGIWSCTTCCTEFLPQTALSVDGDKKKLPTHVHSIDGCRSRASAQHATQDKFTESGNKLESIDGDQKASNSCAFNRWLQI
jgi:hypothetical protein